MGDDDNGLDSPLCGSQLQVVEDRDKDSTTYIYKEVEL